MTNKDSSAGTNADSELKDEITSVSQHSSKPNVVGSHCLGTSIERVTHEIQSNWIVKCFRYGYRNGWEMNVRMGKFCLRVARHQFAFWKRNDPVFNLLF